MPKKQVFSRGKFTIWTHLFLEDFAVRSTFIHICLLQYRQSPMRQPPPLSCFSPFFSDRSSARGLVWRKDPSDVFSTFFWLRGFSFFLLFYTPKPGFRFWGGFLFQPIASEQKNRYNEKRPLLPRLPGGAPKLGAESRRRMIIQRDGIVWLYVYICICKNILC